ncbi:MAG: AAA domain-containing protein, partial [Candidatus Magnetoglobus multicellularis str. Araruama]
MTPEELIQRIKTNEWNDFECKKSQQGVSQDAYRTVSAFANTCGGYLIFGVQERNERLEIVGVQKSDKVQNDFLSALRTGDRLNHIIHVKEDRFDIDGKTVLVFYIPESRRSEKPVYLKGDIRLSYIRRGAGDEKCTQSEIERFLRDAAAERFDSMTLDYDLGKCFDQKALAWYRNRYESRPNNRSYAGVNNDEFLFQLGLIRETTDGRKPTYASILLFGTEGYCRGILPRPIADCQRFAYRFAEIISGQRWIDRMILDSNIIYAWL